MSFVLYAVEVNEEDGEIGSYEDIFGAHNSAQFLSKEPLYSYIDKNGDELLIVGDKGTSLFELKPIDPSRVRFRIVQE